MFLILVVLSSDFVNLNNDKLNRNINIKGEISSKLIKYIKGKSQIYQNGT